MPVIDVLDLNYRVVSLSFALLIFPAYWAGAQPTEWELKIDKENIQILSRWLETSGDDKVREIKASLTVTATTEQLIAILKDADKAANWMVGAKTSAMLAVHSPQSWYAYTEFNLPWPLQNQDLVALYQIEHHQQQTTKITIEAHPDYQPEYPKIERMQHFEACWTFEALADGKTKVSYCAFTYRKPSAPRWISDPVVQNSLWKTMSGFRALAEDVSEVRGGR